MRRSALLSAAACAACLSGLPAQACAEEADDEAARLDEEARALFNAGRLAFEDGRLHEALEHFQRSYDLSSRPLLLYNIGIVAEQLDQHERALEALETFLAEMPEAENRGAAEGAILRLRAELAAQGSPDEGELAEPERGSVTSEPERPATRSARPLWQQWWLWTIVGAVVAGGVVTAVVLATAPEDEQPLPGRDGVVVETLLGSPAIRF